MMIRNLDYGDEILTVSYDPNALVILKKADSSKNTAKLFLKWRKENAIYFETIFKGTIEKTQQWIKENTTDKKMLFSIFYNSELIGHVGLAHYNKHNNSIVVTNVLRGKRGFAKGLMEAVLKSLFTWIFNFLKISKIELMVFSDNYKAKKLFRKCGMKKIKTVPLTKKITEDGYKWIENKSIENKSSVSRYFDIMEINVEK